MFKKIILILLAVLMIAGCSSKRDTTIETAAGSDSKTETVNESPAGIWEYEGVSLEFDEEALKGEYPDETERNDFKTRVQDTYEYVFTDARFTIDENGKGVYTEIEKMESMPVYYEYSFPLAYQKDTKQIKVDYHEGEENMDVYDYSIDDGKLILNFSMDEQYISKGVFTFKNYEKGEISKTPDQVEGFYIYLPDEELYPNGDYMDPKEQGVEANYLIFRDDGTGIWETVYFGDEQDTYIHALIGFDYDDSKKEFYPYMDKGTSTFYYELDGTRMAIWNSMTIKSFYEKESDQWDLKNYIAKAE